MGHYTVWVLTGPGEGLHTMLEPYNEENDVPGSWPGISFDYFEIERETSPGELAEILHTGRGDTPHTMICPEGQIPWDDAGETGSGYGMPPLIPGSRDRMMAALTNGEEGRAYILDWHA